MTTHIMLDLETFSSKANALIVTIGAVKFDPSLPADQEFDNFHVAIDPVSAQQYSLHIDARTIRWWLDPDRDAARTALLSHQTVDLATALEGFAAWFGPESLPVWGNGATFDNVILRNAYAVVGLECPWNFRHDRCHRTIKNLAPEIGIEFLPGEYQHDALGDARAQTRQLLKIITKVGLAHIA